MRKLTEVEEAKALMTEAAEWSVVRWLKEKKRVRKTADKANEALDALHEQIKDSWREELKAAYRELAAADGGTTPPAKRNAEESRPVDTAVILAAKKLKKADDAAYRAHLDAEETFDEAERQLSTRLAREGCRKAINSWELHETAIRKAEEAAAASKTE